MKKALAKTASTLAICVGMATAAATPIASEILWVILKLKGIPGMDRVGFLERLYCWWEYLWLYQGGGHSGLGVLLKATGGIPFGLMFLLMLSATITRRPPKLRRARVGEDAQEPERAPFKINGTADWMTMDEARRIYPGPHPKWGGIPIGEAYRPDLDETRHGPFDEADPETWGQGGKADLLVTPLTSGAVSGIIVGGAGTYKTMGFTIPVLAMYYGSIFVQDPQQQVAYMVTAMRKDMGQHVAIIDPARPGLGSFNPLICIDLRDPLAITHVEEFVDWCSGAQTKGKTTGKTDDSFFPLTSKELLTCLLTDMLWDVDLPADKKNLIEWRKRIVIPEKQMKKYLKGIYTNSKSSYARDIAGTFLTTTEKTWSGIYKHATSDTKWLSIPAYGRMFSGNSFDPRDILNGKMTVIMQISDGDMKMSPAVGRVVIGCFARIMMRAKGRSKTPVPFVIDEMDNLKYMSIFETLRDQGRKSKAPLFPMWQSTGQIEDTWGPEGKRSWYASAAWRMYLQVNDPETAKELSDRCGTYTVLARTEGTSLQGGSGTGSRSRGYSNNTSLHAFPLLSPYAAQTEVGPDEAIIIPRGKAALRVGRPLWWRRPEMRALIERDTYREEVEEVA